MTTAAYRINGQLAAADAFYAVACNPRRSVVVEACAGAGKTWMLVSRILRALLDGAQPQQVLAITFTRKAAGEMRQRLDEWLQAFGDAACTPAQRVQALRERGASEAEAQVLAPVLGALQLRLLQGGRGIEVRTFHAWFAQLLSHAPLLLLERLQLPAAYELLEDTSAVQGELLRRFHRRVQADAALRSDYLSLVTRHRRGTVAQWLQAAWQRGAELSRADAAGHAENAVPPAAECWPECAGLDDPAALLHLPPLVHQVDQLARQLGAAGKSKTSAAAGALQAALQSRDAASAFDGAWQALFTNDDAPRKQLGDTPLQLSVLDGLQRIREMRLQQAAWLDQTQMLRLSRTLLTEYASLKRRRGLVDMNDLERVAEALLGDAETAGWVQERLDQQLQQVLIDEFQDTSPLQWQVLHAWLSAYAGAGGGASGQRPPALFIVGDPKQSIYRFRGAEPRVFEAARDFVVAGLDGTLLQCDHTRRNAPAVIDVLNAVFEDAQRLDGWGPYRVHTTGSDRPGSVCSLPGVRRPAKSASAGKGRVWRDSLTEPRAEPEQLLRAAEASQVAQAVAELTGPIGLQPGEVMVLARKRATLALVADALAAQGVPHVVAEPLALNAAPEALDLLALLDVLASPGHDLSLARALKSPIFGASDHDLLWLARTARGAGNWRAALLARGDRPSTALQRAAGLMQGWLAAAETLPPHDLLDRIVDESDLMARLAAAVPAPRRPRALQAVQALLAGALSAQGGRFISLYGFVRAARAGRVQAQAGAPAAAVQLLTVHGAKGLEAKAVVLADTDPERRPAERALLLVDWTVDERAPARIAFVRNESRLAPTLRDLWQREAEAAQRETLNGLYVAMTRAREWLVFSHTEPYARSGGRSWWARAQGHCERWAPSASPPAAPGSSPATIPTLPMLTWQPPALPNQVAADVAAARLGQAIHRVLEWAGQPSKGGDSWDLAEASSAAARSLGLPPGQRARVAEVAGRILASPACARFFRGPALRWAGNEVPMAAGDQVLRIDRLVLLADPSSGPGGEPTWWVLDYKLHHAPAELPAYREQLASYARAVQALQAADRVRAAFITARGELIEP